MRDSPPDMRAARFHPDLSMGLVALNHLPASVVLSDLCVVLESKWLLRCEVLPPLTIPERELKRAVRAVAQALTEAEARS